MDKQISQFLNGNKVLCAPICGFTDFAFREILALYKPAMIFTEMLSAQGIIYNFDRTIKLYKKTNSNVPLGIQIFGKNPDILSKATDKIKHLDFDLLDINAGCSVKKVIKSGAGCAIMQDPDLIYSIIRKVKNQIGKPVTIKMRKGFSRENFIECAKAAQEAGVGWITLHARTRKQMFSGDVDLEAIKQLKQNIDIPVIGNGEIWQPEHAKHMMDYTRCDAVMLARGILGNPWLVKQCNDYFNIGEYIMPDNKEKQDIMLKHLELITRDKGEKPGLKEFRKHIVKYSKGINGSRLFRTRAVQTENKLELLNEINALFGRKEAMLERI